MHRWLLAGIFTGILCGLLMHAQGAAKARVCFIGAKDLQDKAAPNFDQYPSRGASPRTPAKLDLHGNPTAKLYRTVIRHDMSQGANFGGYYRLAVWGCGSSCAQFAVVNLRTGRVITAQNVNSVSGVHFAADDFLPKTDSKAGGFRFNSNSRLLVLIGSINEDNSKEGAFYYVLKGEKLSLIHKTIAVRNTCEAGPN